MTIFGPDISSYQHGLELSRLTSASFVIAKTTEGTYYTDADYQGWRQQAAQLGRPFIWYHFLSGEDPHAQVQHTAANVGDSSLPGMLDAEPEGSFSPTLAQIIAYVDAAHAAGLRLHLLYLPHWYWQQMGSPDLSALTARGVHLVSSSYPGGTGSPAGLYPGDNAAGWQAYGGITPALYQFTDKASDGGQNIDYNAFRGTAAELATLIDGSVPGPPPEPSISLSIIQMCAREDPARPQGVTTNAVEVTPVQNALVAEGLLSASDKRWGRGAFGSMTVAAYAAWQRRLGYSGAAADGIPGLDSLTKLGAKHGFHVVP